MKSQPAFVKVISYTSRRQVDLVDWPHNDAPLGPTEIAGRTLATLISPGTEINAGFDVDREKPGVGGYAAVFEIDSIGEQVRTLRVGQRAFCMGGHAERQRTDQSMAVPVPDGLTSQRAVAARLMGVSWSTLTTTLARPCNRVLVTGLGPVGNLAGQIFSAAGYDVYVVDPVETRRALAGRCGLINAFAKASDAQAAAGGDFALCVECSGHEAAVLDGLKAVRKGGEVVLVGVPWKKKTDLAAFEVLHAVFHRYVKLRSGWEWELPVAHRDFATSSILDNLAGALHFLAKGRVSVDAIFHPIAPSQCQFAYDQLFHQRGEALSYVFDWA
jgi:threonine dehydrogenase-like Zn-dependent dehydrogenase